MTIVNMKGSTSGRGRKKGMSGFIDLQDPDKPYACDRKYIFCICVIFWLMLFKSFLCTYCGLNIFIVVHKVYHNLKINLQ